MLHITAIAIDAPRDETDDETKIAEDESNPRERRTHQSAIQLELCQRHVSDDDAGNASQQADGPAILRRKRVQRERGQ